VKIYNSLIRKKETFKPIKPRQVSMYVCGPTVYDEPHIGHARAAYIFEIIRNYFEYKGYKVKFVKNITDVDDKIIAKAKEERPDMNLNEATSAIAAKYTQRYCEDMQALGIRRATSEPKATEHIEQMQRYISRLIKKKYAYESEGSVYFDVHSFPDYGRLSGQDLEQMRSAVRIEKDEKKKDALDFALWKKAKANEPSWDSPWGRGRPGWHIECSVMSSKYLGEEFDIHGGGMDLIFPHHENEIAQARCFSTKKFAHIWMHNGLLTIKQQKMAKSLGNFVSVKDFLRENNPTILKLFFLSCHYRKPIDFNEEKIQETKRVYERLQIFSDKLMHKVKKKKKIIRQAKLAAQIHKFKQRFVASLDDDFNTPQAREGYNLYSQLSLS
jgi:cysteinyl-tRNA synthetase